MIHINWKCMFEKDDAARMRNIGIPVLSISYAMFQHISCVIETGWEDAGYIFLLNLIRSAIVIIVTWIGCELIARNLDFYFPWTGNLKKRLAIQSLFIGIYSTTVIVLFLIYIDYLENWKLNYQIYIANTGATLITSFMVNSIAAGVSFFQNWKTSIILNEKLSKALLESELDTLKNQVNPHFLFNSLNTLSTLIAEESAQSGPFVDRLAEVYRYILINHQKNWIDIQDELEVLSSYIFLYNMRFGQAFSVQMPKNIPPAEILTLSLQTLIENCIKHNIVSISKPLQIDIGIEGPFIWVKNNLQLKSGQKGTGTGLSNLAERCQLSKMPELYIEKTEIHFLVKLPIKLK